MWNKTKSIRRVYMTLIVAFAAMTSNAGVLFDTLPSDDQANFSADCGQTWMTGSLGTTNKLVTIEVATRGVGANGGNVYLAVYENNAASGNAASWSIGNLVAASTNQQDMSVGATVNTFEFSGEMLSDNTRYLYTFVNASMVGVSVGTGVTLSTGGAEQSAYDAGGIAFGGAHTIASRITTTDGSVTPPPAVPYAWYRADIGITTNTSGVVTDWADQTTGSHDLDRIFGSPRLSAHPVSGGGTADVVDFDGSSSLWAASADWGSLAGNRTVVAHVRLDGTGNGFLFDGSTGAGITRAQVRSTMWQVGVQSSGFGNADTDTGAITDQAWQTHIFQYDESGGNTLVTHWIDGVETGHHTNAVDTALGGLIVGANGSATMNLKCRLAELHTYNRLLTPAERTTLEADIDSRWGSLTEIPFTYQSNAVFQTPQVIPNMGIHGLIALELTSLGTTDKLSGDAITNVVYNLNGTTDPADIEEVQLYTSSSATFSTSDATLVATVPPATGSFGVSVPVTAAKQYLWIAAKLAGLPADGDHLDAEITEFTLAGPSAGTYVPATTAPPGFLTIQANAFYSMILRQGGDDGSGNYRIPGLATTTNGTLIAAFDVRWDGNEISAPDLPANIDTAIMRSTDGGFTWDPMQIIMDYDEAVPGSQGNGVGDPCIFVDTVNGRVWCASLWSFGNNGWNGSGPGLTSNVTGQLVLNYSDDDGLTWTDPVSITPDVKDSAWRLYFQGPGKGICTRAGDLVFPAQYRDAGGTPRSNFIYSTDRGTTWVSAPPAIASGSPWTTESQIVELDDGNLLLSMRNHAGTGERLWCVYSWNHATETIADGSWGTPWHEETDPTVMGSVERYRSVLDGHPWSGLLFANPDSTSREKMTIRLSLDEGQTWPYKRKIDDLKAAYSCMTLLPDGDIGILYETGENSSISRLVFARFTLDWLVGTTDTDGDGISDFNEDLFGLSKTNALDAVLDSDGDGMNNRDEMIAQTLPFDDQSILRPDIMPLDGAFRVSWPSVPYVVYRLEESTNLVSGTWVPVPGMESIMADSTLLSVDFSPREGETDGFYRISLP